MTIQRLEHVGIVVDDLAAATAFFVELGLTVLGEVPVQGEWVDRVVGLDGVRVDVACGSPRGPRQGREQRSSVLRRAGDENRTRTVSLGS
jgi:catechol 2,3-dioxygenase-like lactoylglutathione lyase family enzyme